MAVRIVQNTKIPKGLALAAQIATYLFEQECGECRYFKQSEYNNIEKALRTLQRVAKREK